MFTREEIESKLRIGEDSFTEFKSAADFQSKRGRADLANGIAKTVAALANTGGGHLFLGVEDDGVVTGTGDAAQCDELLRFVSQICRDRIRRALHCVCLKIEWEGKIVIVVEAPGFSPDRPFSVGGKFYVRHGSASEELEPNELKRLLESANYHFDEGAVSGATKDDLDLDEIGLLLKGISHQPDRLSPYLTAYKCIDDRYRPTVSGILFFGRDPQRWLPDARITCVRMAGVEPSSQFLDRLESTGVLRRQIEGAVDFLKRNVSSSSHVEGYERLGQTGPGAIPDEALREILMNAAAHRDYRAASQICVFVYDDRVEIVNPGGLLNSLTLENIRQAGIKQHRNPVIASLLMRFLTSRMESVGIGIPEVFRLMKERGLPEPGLSIEGGHFRAILYGRPAVA